VKRLELTNSPEPTLVTATKPSELSPLEAAIMDACNAIHDARATLRGEELADALEELRGHAMALLERYDRTDGENHPNPSWARPNQRALVLSALGEVSRAVRLERIALKYADTPRRREISLGNIADRLLRLGRYGASVEAFMQAWAESPRSVPVLVTGAQALCLAGEDEQADALFALLASMPDQAHAGSDLSAYLDLEPRLVELAPRLPSLQLLLARRRAQQEGASS